MVLVLIVISILVLISLSILHLVREPIAATYNTIRPALLDGGGEKCLKELTAKKVIYIKLGDVGTEKCPILNAVRITRFQNTNVSSPFTLSCPTASAVASWLDDIQATSIKHMGTLNCRQLRSGSINSEHSFGTAIDISHIDGASVKGDWKKDTQNGKILRKARVSACKHFNNILTPDTNNLHYDHFHLDTGFGFGCNLDKVKKVF